jgi:hypothetical protein
LINSTRITVIADGQAYANAFITKVIGAIVTITSADDNDRRIGTITIGTNILRAKVLIPAAGRADAIKGFITNSGGGIAEGC